MIQQIAEDEFETTSGAKTFKLKRYSDSHWTVMSWNTKQPTRKCFWGCRTFRTLAEVDQHYRAFRGITALVAA